MNNAELLQRLKSLYEYDEHGFFISKKTGKPYKGIRTPLGYLQLTLRVPEGTFRIQYHRAIWLWHHGAIPEFLDHVNRSRSDNRIENLRPSTPMLNSVNRARPRKKHFWPRGVSKIGNGFRAKINVNGKQTHIGCFKTPEEAGAAYMKKAREVYGEFAFDQGMVPTQ